ncbi:MAG: hypothetical protein ACFFC6_17795, partial [Promethearchaeota archaeon]
MKKSLQLPILIFLFLLISFGVYQHSSAYPLVENYIDPFPNWFIQGFSLWYQDGENALGPPDDEVALI